jgi:hypothetical protein
VPVGTYGATRLSNIGVGHEAIDAGGGSRSIAKKIRSFRDEGCKA